MERIVYLSKNEKKEMNETRDLKCQEKGKSLCNVLKRKVVRNSCLWGRRGGGETPILINWSR